jgi:hypothetical protein
MKEKKIKEGKNVKKVKVSKNFQQETQVRKTYNIKNQLPLNWSEDIIITLCIGMPFCRLNHIKID